MNIQQIKQIDLILQLTFNSIDIGWDSAGVIGSRQVSSEIHGNLVKSLVAVRDNPSNKELLSKLDADLRTANAMSKLTDEDYTKIVKIMENS